MKLIPLELIIKLHEKNLEKTGGEKGLLNEDQLHSLDEQLELFIHYTKPDIIQVAAWYLQRLIQNHYFVDGNKRVAFSTMMVFLELNGVELSGSTDLDSLFNFIIAIASGDVSDLDLIEEKLRYYVEK